MQRDVCLVNGSDHVMLATSFNRAKEFLPGVALCAAIALVATLAQNVEVRLFGRAWLEALVLAIIFGAMLRTAWKPPADLQARH